MGGSKKRSFDEKSAGRKSKTREQSLFLGPKKHRKGQKSRETALTHAFLEKSMERVIRVDGLIHAKSLDSCESFQGSRNEPLCYESLFRGLKIANRRFEATRASRSRVIKIGFLLRIDLRKSIRANRPGSRCESPGHLSPRVLQGRHRGGRSFTSALRFSRPTK